MQKVNVRSARRSEFFFRTHMSKTVRGQRVLTSSSIVRNRLLVAPTTLKSWSEYCIKDDRMRSRRMDFSQDWKKLDDRVFATIRIQRGDLKFSPDEKIEVSSPKKKFTAHVLLSWNLKLRDIPLSFLEYDLEAKAGESRQDLYNKLGKRYPAFDQPQDSDMVTIYLLERL